MLESPRPLTRPRSTPRRLLILCAALLAGGCGDDDDDGSDMGSGADMGMERDMSTTAVSCDEAAAVDEGFFSPPDDLPAHAETERGRPVRCARLPTLEASEVDARARRPIGFAPDDPDNYEGPALTQDVEVTLVGYRSERLRGDGMYATGTLYLPRSRPGPVPLLAYVSGTIGLGDGCAPSKRRYRDLDRALWPMVGRGVAVFVPDLIGLGTPGLYAYLEPHDAAHAVLDGVRAITRVLPEDTFDGRLLVAGHSSGGHAALATQALQRAYAPEIELVGAVGVGPAWFDYSIFGQAFLDPRQSTSFDVNANRASFITMYYVGVGGAYDGEDVAWNPIAAPIRDQVREVYETTCIENFDGTPGMTDRLHELAPTLGEVFDESFAASIRSCIFGVCSGVGATWMERFPAARPPFDPAGAPAIFAVSEGDTIIPMASIQEILDRDPVTRGCCFAGETHNTLATVAAPWLADWMDALQAGEAMPTCPGVTVAECTGGEPSMDGGAPMDGGTPADGGV